MAISVLVMGLFRLVAVVPRFSIKEGSSGTREIRVRKEQSPLLGTAGRFLDRRLHGADIAKTILPPSGIQVSTRQASLTLRKEILRKELASPSATQRRAGSLGQIEDREES
jgi:hypothetical protein